MIWYVKARYVFGGEIDLDTTMNIASDNGIIHILMLTLPYLGVQAGYQNGHESIAQRRYF